MGFGLKNYRIVIPAQASLDVKAAALKLQAYWADQELTVVTDDMPAQEQEILLGYVNRPECKKVRPDSYCIQPIGSKLVIFAMHYTTVCAAVNYLIKDKQPPYFSEDYLKNGSVNVPLTWGEYKLVWNDEFDGDELDLDKWVGQANMRMSDIVLTMDKGVVDVTDGKLVLTSHILDRTDEKARYLSNYSITSCDTMNFRYGYMEIRAKVPHYGKGEWPSWWFLDGPLGRDDWAASHKDVPEDKLYGVEVDGFEIFSHRTHVIPNLHKWYKGGHVQLSGIDAGASKSGTRAYLFDSQEDANDWHTYGFLWTPEEMAFSVDGDFYYRYDLSKDFGSSQLGMQCYDRPLYVLFNNMLFSEGYSPKGSWGYDKRITDEDLFPLYYVIDYCRLYQSEDNGSLLYVPTESGKGKMLTDKYDTADHGKHRSKTPEDYK